MYLITGIVVAVLLAFLGMRMIIRALPDVLSENLLRNVESTCETAALVTVLRKPKSGLVDRMVIGLLLLSQTRILSTLVGREHRLEVMSFGRKLLEMIPESSSDSIAPSGVIMATARETIRSIIHQAESNEGEHLYLLGQINELAARLPESLNCAMQMDDMYSQVSQAISRLLSSDQPQVVETAGILTETLHGLEQELSQCGDLNPVVLTDKLFRLNELLELCHEVANEPTGSINARTTSEEDYYEILGVHPDASQANIKSAFRHRVAQFHPDRKEEQLSRVDDPEIKEEIERTFNDRMVQVNLVYEILSDPDKRTLYDAEYSQRKR